MRERPVFGGRSQLARTRDAGARAGFVHCVIMDALTVKTETTSGRPLGRSGRNRSRMNANKRSSRCPPASSHRPCPLMRAVDHARDDRGWYTWRLGTGGRITAVEVRGLATRRWLRH